MNRFPHASWSLVTGLMRARWVRAMGGFRSPRRMFLSMLAVILALVWIGQAVAGILLRESADPDSLRHWMILSLTAYLMWNVVRVVCSKPVEPFEWTPAEQEWLLAAPIPRQQVIQHRVIGIALAGLFKATIFAFVMIPDLPWFPLGLVGMFTALLLIDLIRLSLEVLIDGLKHSERLIARIAVIGFVAVVALSGLAWSLQHSNLLDDLSSAASLGFLLNWLKGIAQQVHTLPGQVLTAPFGMFVNVVLADRLDYWLVARVTGVILMSFTAYWGLIDLDARLRVRRKRLDSCRFGEAVLVPDSRRAAHRNQVAQSKSPRRLAGVGPLAWRQWQGVKHYRSSLAVAITVPIVLACLPALSQATSDVMALNLIAGLAFYSFLLMPTTFKFDFRRDVFRLTVLKSLPASPTSVVIGQLATPVLMTTLYQLTVLVLAFVLKPYPLEYLALGLLILFPVNVIVFGFDNLVFLLYPHRINQEGIQVFLRSILTFTAKGLLFATGLAATLGWIYVSIQLGKNWTPTDPQIGFSLVFGAGICLATLALAVTTVLFLVRAFARFDPSRDLAGLD